MENISFAQSSRKHSAIVTPENLSSPWELKRQEDHCLETVGQWINILNVLLSLNSGLCRTHQEFFFLLAPLLKLISVCENAQTL